VCDDYLWAAGIWEDGEGEMGPCYTMVTAASCA
jgi:putative SOS response-associated peptidase YedK